VPAILDRRPQHADVRKAQMEVVIVLQRRAFLDEGRAHPCSSSGAGTKVGASKFSGSSMTAGGAGRLAGMAPERLTTSAMHTKGGGDPTRFGTTDQTLNLVEPHNAPGKERAISEQSRQGIGTFVSLKFIGRGN